ncbi:SOS response-associated peptidase [Enterobacter sichuanensis]|uniref:SOS response-associated peptidase n=1 Tax=Enterobacter sichuanensis TaxID=2071710 RepID=UPI0021D281AA|nr:SOS response-associated peptidase [Enterobacter sichuanensis]MCU6194888.1 SOS response-associated peptidase [Enterobacter sichuanensis]
MCGRFSQSQTRTEYLAYLAGEVDAGISSVPEPIGRYNVAPGTRVLLLSESKDQLQLDPVLWGYSPEWWHKSPLINARVETAAQGRMFRLLWEHGRAIVFADGWYEWVREGNKKQPYFICSKDGQPVFMAALGARPFGLRDDGEGFVIVTAAADKGLLDIHDRRPLVLTPDAARDWLRESLSGDEAVRTAEQGAVPAEAFTWYPVSPAVGNVKNQGKSLIEPLS